MTHLNRRQLLHSAGAGLAALGLSPLYAIAADKDKDPPKDKEKDKGGDKEPAGAFELPKLPYEYDALEPTIDVETMHLHHDKHHATYVKNLNEALKDSPDLLKMDIVDILRDIHKVPEKIRQDVINNGGGHANHSLFWQLMAPKDKAGGTPSGALAKAIDDAFESFAKFQDKINTAGKKQFGSGWAWLTIDGKGKLDVISTANQDSPYLKGVLPLLGVDVWEHAYYLKYKNDRAKYLSAWWEVVNWKYVGERYDAALKKA